MKNLALVFVAACVPCVTMAATTSIDQAIDQYAKKTVAFLHDRDARNTDDPYHYALSAKRVLDADLNKDGIGDKVAELDFCEKDSCHNTTGQTDVVIFFGKKGGGFQFADARSFDISAKVQSISKNGRIQIMQVGYGDDDPSCCPSIKLKRIYNVVGSKLVEVR